MVISFDFDVDLLSDFTDDPAQIARAINKARIGAVSGDVVTPGPIPSNIGGTHFYDAVYLACNEKLATEAGRKALVIITDAQDEGSKLKLDETIEAAQRTDTVVHVLLIHDPGFSWRPDVAKKLSDETGGRTIELSSEKKLMEAFDQISEELRSQYTVGYCPANPVKDGKFRKIRVATTNKDYLSHEFRPDPGALLHRVSRQSFTRARGTRLREIGEWASWRRERVQVRRPTA